MGHLFIQRLAILPVSLALVHFLGFAYALMAQRINAISNPFVAPLVELAPVLSTYAAYMQSVLQGDFGLMPGGGRGPLWSAIGAATVNSLGLLAIVFSVSLVLGLLLGLQAVRTRPPGAASWLIPLSTVGLAMPGFYIGILLIALVVLYTLRTLTAPPLPYSGFGWDSHLVLPTLALVIRPTFQIAQVTSRLLGEEMNSQYVVAARSLGHSWQRIRWRTALRNVLAPIILTIAGSFRLLLGEMILVEVLFVWPGLGRLLALTLVPPLLSSGGGALLFLEPSVLAATLTVLTALFLLVDLVASLLLRRVDPRTGDGGAGHG